MNNGVLVNADLESAKSFVIDAPGTHIYHHRIKGAELCSDDMHLHRNAEGGKRGPNGCLNVPPRQCSWRVSAEEEEEEGAHAHHDDPIPTPRMAVKLGPQNRGWGHIMIFCSATREEPSCNESDAFAESHR